jgi:dGTPase
MAKYNSGEKRGSLLNVIRKTLDAREAEVLTDFACRSRRGIRRRSEKLLDSEYRQAFSHDVDRILHSLAYTRYIDKTQVFYLIRNDHITHRVLHVQLVSKIARTIGRFLGLNEDLIEAIALGHDIGHTPFGHDGEKILAGLCRKHGIGDFHHNVQSVQFLDRVERKGAGWNLCLQTLDGILCHDGEVHNSRLTPDPEKTFEILDREMQQKTQNAVTELIPMTMEGCVVRMADTIAYIGRDVEDAIRLKMIRRADIPRRIVEVLGDTNGTIVYNLVTDIIQNSFKNPYVAFSEEVSEALGELKRFNLDRIYLNPVIKKHLDTIETLFGMLFEKYLTDIETGNRDSVIFSSLFREMSSEYLHNHPKEAIVRDFIAGMTDQYFLRQCPEELRPRIVAMD